MKNNNNEIDLNEHIVNSLEELKSEIIISHAEIMQLLITLFAKKEEKENKNESK